MFSVPDIQRFTELTASTLRTTIETTHRNQSLTSIKRTTIQIDLCDWKVGEIKICLWLSDKYEAIRAGLSDLMRVRSYLKNKVLFSIRQKMLVVSACDIQISTVNLVSLFKLFV